MFRVQGELILASSSPRRHDLLRSCGIEFRVLVSNADETQQDNEAPQDMVRRLALLKANVIAEQHPAAWVLGADTTVVLAGQVLGKPENTQDAERMLELLQGKTHEVWGGFAILNRQHRIEHIEALCTKVTIQPLSSRAIQAYVATGEPRDKAGAYAAQGLGAAFIQAIDGSYTNVVGLPLAAVLSALQRFGALKVHSSAQH